ncbi:MAG TPA: AAA family ATPase, partial [Gammaproteobacteria bacterium]|nr:AAA family ATPase [Gammaproteobacteria bacterium]
MLRHVHINHFAIIDSVALDFHPGMTALTGETGAGKSILIDALSLAMGDRAGSGVVRTGAKRAEISLTLDISRLPTIAAWLTELELDNPDAPFECVLRRTVQADGGSKAYINSHAVPLQRLRELTCQLVDIHGQHAHHLLLKPDTHRFLLDLFSKNKSLCSEVKNHYQQWKKTKQQLTQLLQNIETTQNQLALLSFQLQELDELSPQTGEWQQLTSDHQRLSHAESLLMQCDEVITALAEGEELSLIQHVEKNLQLLQKLIPLDPKLTECTQLLDNALIQMQEAHTELRHYTQHLELDPQRLQHMDARMAKMHALARKHRIEPEQLPALQQKIQQQLQQMNDPHDQILQLEDQ